MPCWYYDKKELRNTPSIQDNIDYDTECRYRKEGARFIMDAGTKMGLGYNTIATGVVYFHRFYMFHSFKTFPRYVTACCCLFLAGKVEETPKKCKDVVKTARALLKDPQFQTFGEDPMEEVMTLERILLQTIKFDLQVEHPYSYLIKYAKCLKGDKKKLQEMVQMVWTFVNDSLCTTLSLQWEPEIIAVALMYLAGKLSKFEVTDWKGRQPHHLRWWDMFVEDITMELLEDICHQVLDLYSSTSSARLEESPPVTPKTDVTKEKIAKPPMVKSAPGTPNDKNSAPLAKIPKTESAPSPSVRAPPKDVLDHPVKQLPDIPPHVSAYPPAFPPAPPHPPPPHLPAPHPTAHPPAVPPLVHPPVHPPPNHPPPGHNNFPPYPPVNMSIPPPNVNNINRLPPSSKHINSNPGPVRPSTLPQSQYHPYAYPPNPNYFPGASGMPPANSQRPYYPAQM